ncbi:MULTISPECIES: EndoU domain-containing protein [unclassified Flavobacterium]|uniref:EndoU domain-containing protein n=1 Tax=unclassified Flavobacterium TaxID=196869 RepID=UPI00131B9A5F|nr:MULTISPECIES: EndoU domain-containing protein [unclassified Flavobacterium]
MNVQYARVIDGSPHQYTLVDIWKNEIQYFKNQRTFEFLENFHIIRNSHELDIEVFKGRSGKKLKKEFENLSPPYLDNHYTWEAKGVHHKEALQVFGTGGKGRIVTGTKVNIGPPELGYYKAKVEVYNSDFPNNGGWKVKNSKGGMSTFFPDSWSKQKLQEELVVALKNKEYQFSNIWHGTMSDGVKIQFHIDNGVVKTSFPIF